MLLRFLAAALLFMPAPALNPASAVTPSPSPAVSVSPAPSHVDDGDDVIVPPPRSNAPPISPPWIAFGIAAFSLAGLGVAFFFAKHRGRHRVRRGSELEYFEGNYYETDY